MTFFWNFSAITARAKLEFSWFVLPKSYYECFKTIFFTCVIVKAYKTAFGCKKESPLNVLMWTHIYWRFLVWYAEDLFFCVVNSFWHPGGYNIKLYLDDIILARVLSYLLKYVSKWLLQIILKSTVNCKCIYWKLFNYIRLCSTTPCNSFIRKFTSAVNTKVYFSP